MKDQEAYEELLQISRERSLLASCSALLGWDEQTLMPPGGVELRAEQLGLLAGIEHDRATSPRLGERLDLLEGSDLVANPESPAAVNVRELRRQFERKTRLPRSLVEELARVTSSAQHEWVEARKARDFARFLPWVERIVTLKRQEARCLAPEGDPYDPLLDEYEPGASAQDLAERFAGLRRDLIPLVDAIRGSSRRPDPTILARSFPVDRQRLLGEMMASAVGFDFQRGRLDTSAHPFCSGIGPGDCRLTTRYNEHDPGEALFGILHEVGHGLYEQGLAPEHFGTPMGEAISLGIHESQSRLWENAVGRGRAFWRYWYPQAVRIFRTALGDVSPDAFHFAINRVEPSMIRVQADEVTYNIHIIIRFVLERALITGALKPADLPGAWNEAYQRDLGLTPDNDAEGCLQDIHWSAGLFGYFPTYTLGNIYAAQLFARASADLGNLEADLAQGETSGLLAWLRNRVHRQGSRHHPAPLIERATGSAPDPRPLVQSLSEKYGELYGVGDLRT
ncbi:thermostable carboxypeptidase 1 [soil metagenome]